jgi:hypothetical protein
MNIAQIRRIAWKTSSILGDVQAVQRSASTRSAAPVAKRIVRKEIYRTQGRATRSILRSLGI